MTRTLKTAIHGTEHLHCMARSQRERERESANLFMLFTQNITSNGSMIRLKSVCVHITAVCVQLKFTMIMTLSKKKGPTNVNCLLTYNFKVNIWEWKKTAFCRQPSIFTTSDCVLRMIRTVLKKSTLRILMRLNLTIVIRCVTVNKQQSGFMNLPKYYSLYDAGNDTWFDVIANRVHFNLFHWSYTWIGCRHTTEQLKMKFFSKCPSTFVYYCTRTTWIACNTRVHIVLIVYHVFFLFNLPYNCLLFPLLRLLR